MTRGIRKMFPRGLNKDFGSKLQPEEGRSVQQLERRENGSGDEDSRSDDLNSVNNTK